MATISGRDIIGFDSVMWMLMPWGFSTTLLKNTWLQIQDIFNCKWVKYQISIAYPLSSYQLNGGKTQISLTEPKCIINV